MPVLCSVLFLTVLSAAAGELGPPSLLLRPRTGPAQFSRIEDVVSGDGTFFVLARAAIADTKSIPGYTAPLYGVVVSSDGRQVAPPVLLPPFGTAGVYWIGDYVVVSGVSMRVSAKGTLLDRTARPLPHGNATYRAAAGDRILMIYPSLAEFLHADGSTTPLENLPDGRIEGVAPVGRDFGIYYERSTPSYMRVIDAHGQTLRDGRMFDNPGDWFRSDGKTFSINNREKTEQLVFDQDLKLVRSLPLDRPAYQYAAIPGRGYYRILPPLGSLVSGPPLPTEVIEARPDEYRPRTRTFGPGATALLRGDAEHLYVAPQQTASTFAQVHVLSSTNEMTALPPPVELRGPVDRESASIAGNADGVKLLVWNEATSPGRADIFAARLSRTGRMLDAEVIHIGSGCRWTKTSVASDGRDFLVGWSSCADGGASLVTASGSIVPVFTHPLTAKVGPLEASAVFDGEAYVFAWSDDARTYLGRISRTGSLTSSVLRSDVTLAHLGARRGGGVVMLSGRYVYLLRANLENEGSTYYYLGPNFFADGLTPAGDGFLLSGISFTGDGVREPAVMWLSANGVDPADRRPATLVPQRYAYTTCDASRCTMLWKTWSVEEPAQTLAATIGRAADGTATITEPVAVATHDAGMRWGEVVDFRGTAEAPEFLLDRAPDAVNGGMQFFVRNTNTRRRTVRP
jgi:hypothetical protein